MSGPWDTHIQIQSASLERVEATAEIPDDSPFFDGHFPDSPVVPGIAMLAMVERAVELGLDGAAMTGFARVRFRKAIEQGGQFGVLLTPNPKRPGRLMFKVTFAGERVCDGQVVMEGAE